MKTTNGPIRKSLAGALALTLLASGTSAWAKGQGFTFALPQAMDSASFVVDPSSCEATGAVDLGEALLELKQRSRETQSRIVAKNEQIKDLDELAVEAGSWIRANAFAGLVPALFLAVKAQAAVVAGGPAVAAYLAYSGSAGVTSLAAVFSGIVMGQQQTSIDESALSEDEKALLRDLSSKHGIEVRAIDLDQMSPGELYSFATNLINDSRKLYDVIAYQFKEGEPESDFTIDPVGFRDAGYMKGEVEQARVQLEYLKNEQKMISVLARELAEAGNCRYTTRDRPAFGDDPAVKVSGGESHFCRTDEEKVVCGLRVKW